VLPTGGFEDAAAVERLLGPHEVRVTYYDAAFEKVTTATKPGRYGAVVDILPRFHPPLRQAYTLFRAAEPIDWPGAVLSVKASALRELGLESAGFVSAVMSVKASSLQELGPELAASIAAVRTTLGDRLTLKEEGAMLLAWRHEKAKEATITERNEPAMAETRWWHELERRTGSLVPYRYRVQLPEPVAKDPTRKWPTILSLHGSGGRGLPLSAGTPALRQSGKVKPDTFIVIAPRCPANSWWSMPALEDLLTEVCARYPVDPDRLYLTGESMGGFGSWTLLAAQPDRFAAAVPICGGGDPREAELFKDVPVWVFHGAKDKSALPEKSREMVEALRRAGGRVRYTQYPDQGHDIWDTVYAMPEVYDWLLQQVRGKPGPNPARDK
jgi:predicted esterase